MQAVFDQLITIVPSVVAVIVAFTSYLVVYFNSRKTRLQLEQEKLELEKLTYQGSYVICPDCQRKIYLKDMIFEVDRVSIKEKK